MCTSFENCPFNSFPPLLSIPCFLILIHHSFILLIIQQFPFGKTVYCTAFRSSAWYYKWHTRQSNYDKCSSSDITIHTPPVLGAAIIYSFIKNPDYHTLLLAIVIKNSNGFNAPVHHAWHQPTLNLIRAVETSTENNKLPCHWSYKDSFQGLWDQFPHHSFLTSALHLSDAVFFHWGYELN